MHQEIHLSRAVEAIQIPRGDEITLPIGTRVMITQSLGGSYTVATDFGLARIREKDADALGIEPKESGAARILAEKVAAGDVEGAVWESLKTVFDPEIPVDIVNLGLVYDCQVQDVEGRQFVNVKMTLTAPGCGMGPSIAADARSKILAIDGVEDAKVELVWDPPWSQDMITEEGRMKLGMI
jgi:probable FeS assembly SUF system protein SufT